MYNSHDGRFRATWSSNRWNFQDSRYDWQLREISSQGGSRPLNGSNYEYITWETTIRSNMLISCYSPLVWRATTARPSHVTTRKPTSEPTTSIPTVTPSDSPSAHPTTSHPSVSPTASPTFKCKTHLLIISMTHNFINLFRLESYVS